MPSDTTTLPAQELCVDIDGTATPEISRGVNAMYLPAPLGLKLI